MNTTSLPGSMTEIQERHEIMEDSNAFDLISRAVSEYGEKCGFACSFGPEDMVILDMLDRIYTGTGKSASVFTLDTGRLHSETYELMHTVHERYKVRVGVYFPDAVDVEEMVTENGMNLFYQSVEKRKLCCEVRKVKPLSRALKGKDAWITGLRRAQSKTRSDVPKVHFDKQTAMVKISPLADWSDENVWEYIQSNKVPYNKLHDAGYPSIGCQPCTRAVLNGEDSRSGRWWWEDSNRECGLHFKENGKEGN